MKLRLIIYFILYCLFTACTSLSYEISEDEKIVNKITSETARKLKREKKLYLVGTGGRMMHEVEMMYMGFDFFKEINLNEARELLIYAINEYLYAINNNEEIRQYLITYPFTAKNVEIGIWVRKPDGDLPDLDKIYYISAIDGVLSYYLDLPETYSRQLIWEETFAEAQRITLLDSNVKE